MRNIRTAVFASIAALAVLGAAVAASNDNHVMKLDLPDGSIARIDYQGSVAGNAASDALAAAPGAAADEVPAS